MEAEGQKENSHPGCKWGGGGKWGKMQSSDYREMPNGQLLSRSGPLSRVEMIYPWSTRQENALPGGCFGICRGEFLTEYREMGVE